MSSSLYLFPLILLTIISITGSAHGQRKILCIGDSITAGFPHGDNHSYHSELSNWLPSTPDYIGSSNDTIPVDRGADGMASNAMQYIVGGDGKAINGDLSMLGRAGAKTSFDLVSGSLATPDEVAILIGVNDLISLIYSSTTPNRFIPGTVPGDFGSAGGPLPAGSGDFTDSGVYLEGVTYNSSTETYHYPPMGTGDLTAIDSLIDRYEDLVDAVRTAFPLTHIILITVPIPDAAGLFNDVPFQAAKVALKPAVKQFNSQIIALASTLGSGYSCVDPGLIEPINPSDPGSPTYVESPDIQPGDGLHPSQDGYDKIGRSLASVILYRIWAEAAFPTDFDFPATESTIWGAQADPDSDGWSNAMEHYLDTDPNTPATPELMVAKSGSTFTFSYQMNEDLVVNSVDVEYSTDLSTWVTAGLTPQTEGTPSGGQVPVTTTLTLSSWDRVFFRLRPALHHP